jgi:diguanylate cyclase (GGDEF)-like protein/PAS domain S-box-containing protein
MITATMTHDLDDLDTTCHRGIRDHEESSEGDGGDVSSRRLMASYWACMGLLVCAYYAFASLHMIFWSAIGLTGAAGIVAGVARNRPRRRAPWLLVCAALVTFTAGDAAYLVLTDVMGQVNPFPSIADVFNLAMYALLTAGLLVLPRSATGRDRAGFIDVLVITAGLGLLMWIFLISPYVGDSSLGVLEKATSIAYPLFDIVVLAAGVRLVTAVPRCPAVVLLAVGGVALLATDIVYGLSQLYGSWTMGSPVDAGWIVVYTTWGAAALHPSMVLLTEPRVVRESRVTATRLVVLGLSALIAPVVLVVEGRDGTVKDAHIIAVMSALIFGLVMLRLAGVVRAHSQAMTRERGLREASAAMVSATDSDMVAQAAREAVAKLLPVRVRHEVLLLIDDSGGSNRVYPPPGRPRATGTEAVPGDPRAARYVDVARLPEPLAARMAGLDIALVHPLVVIDRPADNPHIGDLLVGAEESGLVAIEGAVGALASQSALAIERITLNNEIARRRSDEYFRTLVQNSSDVILIVNDDDRVRYASPSAAILFGDVELTGRLLSAVVEPQHRESAHQVLALAREGHDGAGIIDWSVRGSGGVVQVEVSCRDLRDDPTVDGLVVTLRDVTERRRLERELTHRAYHDSLTGLANRVLFADRVQEATLHAHHSGAVVGVLFIDLDDFKEVNDTLGHEIGDQLLAAVGHRLSGALRGNDMAARLGGDEFAILIEQTRDPEDIEQIAERIVKTLAEPIVLAGHLVSGSASLGVATTIEAAEGTDLLRQADLALYVAKGAGKGRWRRYQPALHTALVQRLELRSALDQALADGAFRLQYQPIVTLVDGRTVGFEALMRWHHPTRGLILPGDFIDVAEDSGLIVPIGDWVLERAVGDAVRWMRAAPRTPAYLSINVSARQFRTPGFVDKIRQELIVAGLPPRRLMLEITESLLLRDDEQIWSDLSALRDIGVRVAIDDFGTGYSSLSHLRQVPVDVIKIDKSFIDTMSVSEQQRALVEGIVRLAHTLGLEVVAEGVQRSGDRELLVRVGCRLGQGFLFASPMDEPDVVEWLRRTPERIAA